jgi:hypothetical protein
MLIGISHLWKLVDLHFLSVRASPGSLISIDYMYLYPMTIATKVADDVIPDDCHKPNPKASAATDSGSMRNNA